MKVAKVAPVFEREDKHVVNNQPISFLPTIRKTLYEAVNFQLFSYLTEHILLIRKHFSFRKVLPMEATTKLGF